MYNSWWIDRLFRSANNEQIIMITFDQFLEQNDGKPINWDGAYGNQCWDVAAKKASLVDGCPSLPTGPVGGASEVFTVFADPLPIFYNKINYVPGLIPQKGWIPVWGPTSTNKFGHIAGGVIVADESTFISLDQNWPQQGYYDKNGDFIGTGVAHYQKHNYNGVLGFLAPKKGVTKKMTALEFDTFVAELYNKVAARNPSQAEWDLHREQYAAQGDKWCLEMVKGFTGDDVAWKKYERAVIEGGEKISELEKELSSQGEPLKPGKYVVK